MKAIKYCAVIICFLISVHLPSTVSAQCAMCSMNAENSVKNGNTQGNNLNKGILYLLAAPYVAVAAIGFIWYKKYRRKNVLVDMKDEKINLN